MAGLFKAVFRLLESFFSSAACKAPLLPLLKCYPSCYVSSQSGALDSGRSVRAALRKPTEMDTDSKPAKRITHPPASPWGSSPRRFSQNRAYTVLTPYDCVFNACRSLAGDYTPRNKGRRAPTGQRNWNETAGVSTDAAA